MGKKYLNIITDKIVTEEELYEDYIGNAREQKMFPTFVEWLEEHSGSGGFLSEMPTPFRLFDKRAKTASRLAQEMDCSFIEIFDVLREIGVFGNWTLWEIGHRPVNYDELIELVEERLEEKNG